MVKKKALADQPRSQDSGVGVAAVRQKNVSPKKGEAAGRQARFATVEELMGYAYAMETEAAERYAEFAGAMESHNNHEVAELFGKLSRIELQHSRQILESMDWKQAPAAPGKAWRWQDPEHAETADGGDLHYLMHPYHALKIALQNELRAQKFFAKVVRTTTSATVRATAAQMEREEAEHVQLVENWLARTAVPDSDWARDADPPRNYD